MSLSKFLSTGLVLTVLAVAATQPAIANDSATEPVVGQVKVSYGDLNIQSPIGADSLVKRIAQAAKRACGSRPALVGPGSRIAQQRYKSCLDSAQQAAVSEVNQPAVTAAHARQKSAEAERIAGR